MISFAVTAKLICVFVFAYAKIRLSYDVALRDESIRKRYIVIRNFFFIQFNVPFKIISLKETSLSVGGAKREYPGNPPDTLASRT